MADVSERACSFCGMRMGEGSNSSTLRTLEAMVAGSESPSVDRLMAEMVVLRERLAVGDDPPVEHLVAGPGIYICNFCVDLCNEVIAKERAARAG